MLVLSRKSNEEIVLPRLGIVFKVLEIRGDKVRIGIAAPSDIPVYRQEVWERIQAEEAAATPHNGSHNGSAHGVHPVAAPAH
ncbi:MAG: carbon storage regulator [Planctomycetia bacterium]|nr:carbon storage regulator [Planctomycetia bacterium]